MSLELGVVEHQVFLTRPVDGVGGAFDLLDDGLLAEAHVDILKDSSLQEVFIDDLVLSILLDLLEDTSSQLDFAV